MRTSSVQHVLVTITSIRTSRDPVACTPRLPSSRAYFMYREHCVFLREITPPTVCFHNFSTPFLPMPDKIKSGLQLLKEIGMLW